VKPQPDRSRSFTCSGCGKIIRQDIQRQWYAADGPWIPPPGRDTYAALDPDLNPEPWHCLSHRTTERHYPEPEHERK